MSVVEDAGGVTSLHVNNRQQEGSSATLHADARQALLPILLHPAPRRALFLGLGTGVTAWSATRDPLLQVEAVELFPEVVEASEHFTRMLGGGPDDSRLPVTIADDRRFDVEQVRERLAGVGTARIAGELGIDDELALLGSFIAGPRALARFAANAPLDTDGHPVVAYRAPRITYVPDSRPRDRLVALLRGLDVDPGELLAASVDPAWVPRLTAYWAARNRFIEAGRSVLPTADVKRMLAQVRWPLLAVLHISPEFRPTYDPLLRMAAALGETDVGAARALLLELHEAQPSRPDAARALHELAASR